MTDTQTAGTTADDLTARNIARLARDPFAGIPNADDDFANWPPR